MQIKKLLVAALSVVAFTNAFADKKQVLDAIYKEWGNKGERPGSFKSGYLPQCNSPRLSGPFHKSNFVSESEVADAKEKTVQQHYDTVKKIDNRWTIEQWRKACNADMTRAEQLYNVKPLN